MRRRLRGDKYAEKTDGELARAARQALSGDPRVRRYDVDVGVATLTGIVDNLEAKRAAAQDVENTVGCSRWWKVRAPDERSDPAIEADVRSALERSPAIERYDATVSVEDGVVSLRVAGVVRVRNRLEVNGEA